MWQALLILVVASSAPVAGAGPLLPVFFVANRGQAPRSVRFVSMGSGLTAYFTRREILLSAHGDSVHVRFEGSPSAVRVEGVDPLPGHASFLTGPRREWHPGEPMFGAVRYRGLYSGIDMVYDGAAGQLKSRFIVAPGADPSRIRIRYSGYRAPTVEADGSLWIRCGGQSLREEAPYVYQERPGDRVTVTGGYAIHPDGAVHFDLGPYDRTLPLIIDPPLSFDALLGGTGFSAATAIAVDAAGALYIAGYTDAYNLPTTAAEQSFNAGGNEVFVAKLNPSGTAFEYCTYLGGSGDDRAYGIAVDAAGAAYVAGFTTSPNFPTQYPIQNALNGGRSAFVLKLSAAGNTLIFSTYLGGNGSDTAYSIAVDSAGSSYIAGDTTSMDFPAAGFQTGYQGAQDVFVAKISADGRHLLYSTYLGGSGTDHGAAIAVDSGGTAYVTGYTWSLNFPVANALQRSIAGGCDAFVARLSADGNSLLFSTYFGGSGGSVAYPEAGQGIALDSQGDVYVAGVTSSADFPLARAAQPELLGSTDAFICKISPSGSLLYSTYMGGSGVEIANAIAVDSSGAAYVVGYTYSTDFPVTAGAQAAPGGDCDAFLVKLSPAGETLLYATYLGGSGSDAASGVAVDGDGNVYIAGWTFSPDFPVANGHS